MVFQKGVAEPGRPSRCSKFFCSYAISVISALRHLIIGAYKRKSENPFENLLNGASHKSLAVFICQRNLLRRKLWRSSKMKRARPGRKVL